MKYQVSLHTKHHIFIHEDNMLSAHMKDHCHYVTYKNCSLWNDLVFHWHLYNKRNITQLPGDIKFLFMLKNPHTSTYVLKSSQATPFLWYRKDEFKKTVIFLSKESDSEHYVQLKVHMGI